jgi:hypothetical protein
MCVCLEWVDRTKNDDKRTGTEGRANAEERRREGRTEGGVFIYFGARVCVHVCVRVCVCVCVRMR